MPAMLLAYWNKKYLSDMVESRYKKSVANKFLGKTRNVANSKIRHSR